jgi:CelD/BcsL family acetyltransferase involved in cellulose biosynthesis
VCADEGLDVAADALRAATSQAEVDLVLAELLPGNAGWSPRLGARPLLRESSPSIALDGGWDAYLAGRSRNLREQIRRRELALHRGHHVEFRRTVDRERLASDLALLFGLHRSRWGHASAFVPFAAFHEDFAELALERGWLRLWFLELDGRAVAAWYGFRYGETECYYQAGRDVSFRGESLGLVLLAHTIREAAADGVNVYRLLRGAEPFKLRLATADAGVETFAFGRGLRGGIGRVAAGAALRQGGLRAALRKLGR